MLGLGDCLHLVVAKLPFGDRILVSRTCRELRSACRRALRRAKLSQQDFEEELDLPPVGSLWLHAVDCAPDFAAYVADAYRGQLQQLQELRFSLPGSTDGLAQLLACCTSLTSLTIEGDCSISWPTSPEGSRTRPLQLQQLALQRNSQISPGQLLAWLSTPPAVMDDDDDSRLLCAGLQQLLLQNECSAASDAPSGDSSSNHFRCSSSHSSGNLLPAWPQLNALDLSGCNKLGGSWGFIALCPSLKLLALHSCYKVTNATLQAFCKAISSAGPDDNSASSDSSCSNSVTNGSSSALRAGGGIWPSFPGLQLCQLSLAYTRVSDAGMPHLAIALPRLQSLSLKGCNVGDDGLLHLLQLQHLTGLNIKHCHRITEDGIQQLSVLSGLRSLAYGFTSMPDADQVAASVAQQFKRLTALDLLMSELTNMGLAALGAGLPQLMQLRLYQAGVTDDALNMLAEQPGGHNLQSLVLYGLGGLRELRCLAAFPSLRQLQLGSLCDLKDMAAAVAQLSVLTRLQQLTLERMDGVSVQCLREVLRGCISLEALRVRGCDGVSANDMAGRLATEAAGVCHSSASLWWAASPSCDTDDEEDGWQLTPM